MKLQSPLMHNAADADDSAVCCHQNETFWQTYSRLVDQYLFLFEFTDDAISRLLFFSPLSSSEKRSSRWREVVWGLLQLHRLTIDMALRQRRCLPMDSNHFGTTIKLQEHHMPTTSVRIALTVLQSLGPILQELVCSTTTTHDQAVVACRQSKARAIVERVRFLLRGYLLVQYWRRFSNQWRFQSRKEGGLDALATTPGLLMDGGLFQSNSIAPTLHQELARVEREQYVGRRSGRRLGGRRGQRQPAATITERTPTIKPAHRLGITFEAARVLTGEVLYITRPLYQAETELLGDGKTSMLLKSWLSCLAMDLSSLWSLAPTASKGNQATQSEWKRRRLRLLLYLLRVPVWDEITYPAVDKMSKMLEKVPLFGRLCSNYLWEWLYYWRLFRAEEG